MGDSFQPLLVLNTDIDNLYNQFKTLTNAETEAIVGCKPRKPVQGMSEELRDLYQQRRTARLQMLKSPQSQANRQNYQNLNQRVKRAVKMLKEENMERKVMKMEQDFVENNSQNLFKTVRELEGKPKKSLLVVKDKSGKTKNQLEEVLKC